MTQTCGFLTHISMGNLSTIGVGNQKQTVIVIALGVCAVEEERTGLKWVLKMVIWTARR